jgi:GNAT superfamily N-acetyltransferase
MAAFSQLAEFARNFRPRPEPGIEVVDTPRYVLQLIPNFPTPGPNHVEWIRCTADEADRVIHEAVATAGARGLSLGWILDPDTRPADFGERLQAHGFVPEGAAEEIAVMVLPVSAQLDTPAVDGLEIRDALRDLDAFTASERAAEEAFSGIPFGSDTGIDATREGRFADTRAAGNRRRLLATIDGEPAGSSSIALYAPDGAIINGGAVRPKFRGRGVYRAMVAARLRMAGEAGAAGLVVWGGHMSRPILERLGFETVSRRRFYVPAER